MLKRVICCLLILSFFSSQLSRLSIYVNFKINQDFIADVLCINKDIPTSTCNGKCYLTKELKAQEEKENAQLPKERNERTETLFCSFSEFDYVTPTFEFLEKDIFLPKYLVFRKNAFIEDIFHPPQLG